jgi:rare lipoprotein A
VLVTGCAPTAEHRDDLTNQVAVPPPAVDPAVEARAAEIAAQVRSMAKRTEKAEGKHDLVKDEVKISHDAHGQPVVEQKGEASWYGKFHRGKKMANGKRFDQNQLTAAHPTLPLGTKAKVTNIETGKSVDVIINDRGPYAKGRDIDLSKAAAQKVGVTNGVAPVRIEAAVTPAPEHANGEQ